MHRVPSTVAFAAFACRKTPSNLGVFIRSANSMSSSRPPLDQHTTHKLWLTTHRAVILFTLINFLHFACGAAAAAAVLLLLLPLDCFFFHYPPFSSLLNCEQQCGRCNIYIKAMLTLHDCCTCGSTCYTHH